MLSPRTADALRSADCTLRFPMPGVTSPTIDRSRVLCARPDGALRSACPRCPEGPRRRHAEPARWQRRRSPRTHGDLTEGPHSEHDAGAGHSEPGSFASSHAADRDSLRAARSLKPCRRPRALRRVGRFPAHPKRSPPRTFPRHALFPAPLTSTFSSELAPRSPRTRRGGTRGPDPGSRGSHRAGPTCLSGATSSRSLASVGRAPLGGAGLRRRSVLGLGLGPRVRFLPVSTRPRPVARSAPFPVLSVGVLGPSASPGVPGVSRLPCCSGPWPLSPYGDVVTPGRTGAPEPAGNGAAAGEDPNRTGPQDQGQPGEPTADGGAGGADRRTGGETTGRGDRTPGGRRDRQGGGRARRRAHGRPQGPEAGGARSREDVARRRPSRTLQAQTFIDRCSEGRLPAQKH